MSIIPDDSRLDADLIFTQAAINAEADKAGAAGNSDLMAKLKSAATNKKIQGAFMDVKNNGVSAAMKYKDDAERVSSVFVVSGVASTASTLRTQGDGHPQGRLHVVNAAHDAYGRRRGTTDASVV